MDEAQNQWESPLRAEIEAGAEAGHGDVVLFIAGMQLPRGEVLRLDTPIPGEPAPTLTLTPIPGAVAPRTPPSTEASDGPLAPVYDLHAHRVLVARREQERARAYAEMYTARDLVDLDDLGRAPAQPPVGCDLTTLRPYLFDARERIREAVDDLQEALHMLKHAASLDDVVRGAQGLLVAETILHENAEEIAQTVMRARGSLT